MRRMRMIFLGALLACLLAAPAHATQLTDAMLKEVSLPVLFGGDTFTVEDTEFHRILIPAYVRERYAQGTGPVEGVADPLVEQVKKTLNSDEIYPKNEFVTYTQVRHEVVSYFDSHLALFLKTVYTFCGMEDKTPCLDELTLFILDQLPALTPQMRNDIEVLYKYNMTIGGTQGTIARDGAADGLYYFAQTDPDWAELIFEFEGNGATLKDRGCGCACAAMVFSTYHKVEITPKWMRTYALAGDWPVSYGLPNEYFQGIARQYTYLETERYGTVLNDPTIVPKAQLDMEQLARQIGEEGYMAIIHVVAGAFTGQEHYMVLADYEEIDGVGYFLVADPYIQPSRYRNTDQMRDVPGDNQGLVYAASSLLYRDCKSVILFSQDRNDFPLSCKTERAERVDRLAE